MKKIYIVISGCNSDYQIDTVFSDEEIANKYVAMHGGDSDGYGVRVEEYNLDEFVKQVKAGYAKYFIRMKYDGNSFCCGTILTGEKCQTSYELVEDGYGVETNLPKVLQVKCNAESIEQATKIANEIRTKLIANDEWRYE
jgi:hypothetical protein